jgi:type IX secretion system PorP/SprF family membrane protein
MKHKKLVVFLTLFIVSLKVISQDFSSFTQFYMNPYAVNPSYAGTDGRSALFLTYRKQWAGIDDAPTLMNLSYHTPFKSNANFGLNINSDTRGVLATNSVMMTVGYTLPIAKDQYIRFGVSGGVSMNSLDLGKLENELILEPGLIDLLDQNLFALGNVGFSYHKKYFNLGISIPQLFESAYTTFDNFTVGELAPLDRAIVYTSHRFYFGSDKHAFEPHILYRHQKGAGGQIEVAGLVHLNHSIWFGGSFKQDFGIAALGGVKVNDLFGLGYSYGLSNSGANQINSPTHEVQINYLFGKHKDKKHVHSFIATKKPKKKRNKRKEALEKKKENERLAKEAAAKKREEERLAKEAALKKEREDTVEKEKQTEVDRKATDEENKIEEQQQPVEEVQEKAPIKAFKGDHEDELQEDHYVIVGSFAIKADAERYKKQMLEQGIVVHDGYSTHLNEYYVYTMKTPSAEEARAERDRIRKTEQFKDAWHLEVERDDIEEVFERDVADEQRESMEEDTAAEQQDVIDQQANAVEEQHKVDGNEERHESEIDENGDASNTFSTDQAVVIKKGNHFLELGAREYVVVGAFDDFENAEKYSDQLFEKGFRAKFGYVSAKKLWYVHLLETPDSVESRKERDRYREMRLFKNAWVLTIVD